MRLLDGVDMGASPGLQFRGRTMKPGEIVDPSELPKPAVVLEHAGQHRVMSGRSRYAFAALWILWLFDTETEVWIEIARAMSPDASWSLDLAPVAHRLLYPDPGDELAAAARIAEAPTRRLSDFIRKELGQASSVVRDQILAGLDVYLSSEIAAARRRGGWVGRARRSAA
ncbi:MAG TPA: hypothetical protein VG273_28925 [Bryobacteraceae bacterium]|nr:hypothetical protein [Bryobacteraceae bacterium]